MKAVWTSGKKSKFNFRPSNLINLENGEILCFSSIDFLDDLKNLENIINLTTLDKAEQVGVWSDCHKIKDNFFMIDNDRDGLSPTFLKVSTNLKNKDIPRFYINCGNWDPGDYFEKALKTKKKNLVSSITIKSNKIVFFVVPDIENRQCKTQFKKTDIKKFSKDFNNFSLDRIKKDKFEEFSVPNGVYNIYTFWENEMFGGDDIAGHLIEYKKKY